MIGFLVGYQLRLMNWLKAILISAQCNALGLKCVFVLRPERAD